MKPTIFTLTLAVILIAILSLDATHDRHNRERLLKAPSVSTLNTKEFSQSILQKSEKDLVFIENLGQIKDTKGETRTDVLFLTRSDGVDMYMTNSGITYVFRSVESSNYRLDMEFVGMNEDLAIRKEQAVDRQYHYYAPDYPDGISPKAYKKITIENLYEGIDLVYYENEGRMKYDFILKAGADAGKIQMKYNGATSIQEDGNGNVIITTPMGEIREGTPYTYSSTTGLEIDSRYQVKNNTVLFDVAKHAKSEDIIIDPVRVWATYYGGSSNERARSICADNDGNIYVTGRTISDDFPSQSLSGSYNQSTYGGGTWDAFILKFSSVGERLWATYYGGSDSDEGLSICTDNAGNLYVTGKTASDNFPTQTLTGAYNQTASGDTTDVFILKFDSNGARQWATYYGGNGLDGGREVCTDNSNNLYVTGFTRSTDFPTQSLPGAYNQTTTGGSTDAFILKFNSSGARQWATYYGGSGADATNNDFWYAAGGICTDDFGNLYVTGGTESTDFPLQSSPGAYFQSTLVGNYTDAFILKFDSGGARQWATYYGGSVYDGGCGIVTNSSGDLYVTGYTYSHADFPMQFLEGAYNQSFTGGSEAFILKFDNNGARLWATCYGGVGTNVERGNAIALDNSGNLFITGDAQWGQFESQLPVQTLPGAYNQTTHGGGTWDAFILMFDSNGERKWATYYGGGEADIAWGCCTDNSGNFYVTGSTSSGDFPLQSLTGAYDQTTNGGGNDLFILGFNQIYCNSGGIDFSHVYISDVTIGDLTNSSAGSDYSDFTGLTTDATQGTSYPITLKVWKNQGSIKADWRVWIDFNIDGDFDDAGELVFSADNKPKDVNGVITVPSNTSVGMTRMRVSMRDGDGGFGPCDIHAWGEVEDYSVNLQQAIPQPPVADFKGTPTTLTLGNSVDFTDLSLNNPTIWEWDFENDGIIDSYAQNPTFTYNTSGTYTVSLTATNNEGSDTKTVVDYISVNPAGTPTYCESSSQTNALEWIAQVDIDAFSNPSGATLYSDFTGQIVDLSPGSSSNVVLTPGYTGKSEREFWRIWIDFNGDNDFDDAGEQVFTANNKRNAVSGTMSIPSSATGQTRMRISMKNGSSPGPCEVFSTGGEVEDYTVNFSTFKHENISRTYINDLEIFPNPNNGSFKVKIDKDIHPDARLKVYDMKGVLVHDMSLSQPYFELNLSQLNRGIYQISVINGNEYYYSKLVKQ